jgi:hypothetical protein
MDSNEALGLFNDAYRAVGVSRGISQVELLRRRVVRTYHPDETLARWINIEICSLLVSWGGNKSFDFRRV